MGVWQDAERAHPARLRARGRARRRRAPLVIPPVEDGVEETLDALHGLIFSGGGDLDPDTYGAEPHPATDTPKPWRDRPELALLQAALDARHAGARHLPRLAAPERRPRRRPRPAPAGRSRARAAPEHAGVLLRPRRVDRAGEPARRAARRARAGEVAPPPGHRPHRRRAAPGRLGRGRHGRGPRGSRRSASRVGVLWHPEAGEDHALFEALVDEARAYREERRVTTVLNPATEEPLAELESAGRRGDRRRGRAREGRVSRPGARSRRPTARGCCAASRRSSRSTHEELSRIESRNVGKPICGARGEIGMVAAGLPLLRGRGRQALRRDDPRRGRRRHDVPRAARRRRADHPVELPAQHRVVEARPGARVRQHGRAEAGRADAALGAAPRRARARGGDPRGRRSTSSPARARSSGSA